MRLQLFSDFLKRARPLLALGLQLSALACGFHGSSLIRGADIFRRSEAVELASGAPWLLAAFLVWLLAELVNHSPNPIKWWRGFDRLGKARQLTRAIPALASIPGFVALVESLGAAPEFVQGLISSALGWFGLAAILLLLAEMAHRYARKRADGRPARPDWIDQLAKLPLKQVLRVFVMPLRACITISRRRKLLFVAAAIASAWVWENTTGNIFTWSGIAAWLASIVLWSLAFMPNERKLQPWHGSEPVEAPGAARNGRWWAVPVFVLILAVGIHFRLSDLEGMPPQMSGGHYLNLIGSFRISQMEQLPVYATVGGGRAPSNMYFLAALAALPGLRFDYFALKLSVALTSVISLPFMYWLGKEFIGDQRRKLGIIMGLLLLGLVAASYWDVTVHRVGYGFGLVTFASALLGIFMIRAARSNRRVDFILAGVTLGLSAWLYNVSNIFPIAVVAAALIAMALRRITWRERMNYCVNLAVSAFLSFMIFLPQFHFSIEHPIKFYERFISNDRMDRFLPEEEGLPVNEILLSRVMSNIRRHLLMYHWSGEQEVSRGGMGGPTLSASAGALLVLGLAALLAQLAKSRDPVIWTVPAFVLIMHLPAISVIDSFFFFSSIPSHTRTLGALPYIYLLAACPLALIVRQLWRVFPAPLALPLGLLLCGGALLHSFQQNYRYYFVDMRGKHYAAYCCLEREHANAIRGFVDSGGAIGNAILVGGGWGPDWRVIMVEAGAPDYDRWLLDMPALPAFIASGLDAKQYPLYADRDLIFLLMPHSDEPARALSDYFPRGYSTRITSDADHRHLFTVFRVPAFGEAELQAWLASQSFG